MRFVVEVPKAKIIKTLMNDGEFEKPFDIKKEDLCRFIESCIGCQIDGIEPKTEINVNVSEEL